MVPARLHHLISCLLLFFSRVPDGQLINLTLYDFTLPDQHPQDSSLCNIYANVHEPGVSSPPVHVCGGEQRVKTLYISETNEVEIEVITTPSTASSSTGTQPAYFMLKYEGKTLKTLQTLCLTLEPLISLF